MKNNIDSIIIDARDYCLSTEKRLLIPFIRHSKIGFLNNNGEEIIPPRYDDIQGHCYNVDDLIKVGVLYSYNFGPNKNYVRYLYGVIDYNGTIILEPEYYEILVSNDKKILTVRNKEKQYLVLDRIGNLIVEPGIYSFIDKFDHNLARVNKIVGDKKKWGIINSSGKIVLPIEYDEIYNFCDKNRKSTYVYKEGQSHLFYFDEKDKLTSNQRKVCFRAPKTYNEYSGSYAQDYEGWSDEDIDDVFDGDPDAYWNID